MRPSPALSQQSATDAASAHQGKAVGQACTRSAHAARPCRSGHCIHALSPPRASRTFSSFFAPPHPRACSASLAFPLPCRPRSSRISFRLIGYAYHDRMPPVQVSHQALPQMHLAQRSNAQPNVAAKLNTLAISTQALSMQAGRNPSTVTRASSVARGPHPRKYSPPLRAKQLNLSHPGSSSPSFRVAPLREPLHP